MIEQTWGDLTMGSQLKDALKAAGFTQTRNPAESRADHKKKGGKSALHGSVETGVPSSWKQREKPVTHPTRVKRVDADRQARELKIKLKVLHGAYSQGSSASRPQGDLQVKEEAAASIVKVGAFSPHSLLLGSLTVNHDRRIPRHDGIAGQLTTAPTRAADLVLGLDFGTSSVKAVIRDHGANSAFVVPFTTDDANPFLLPSRVWRTGSTYSLDGGSEVLRDLKLGLLECRAASPVAEFNEACAFLALVVRHCRGWFLDSYGARYRAHALTWRVNLGLPARSYEDNARVILFRRLAWAASNCAADRSANITEDLVEHYRQLSMKIISGEPIPADVEFEFDDTDVIPEIAAQIFGFVDSSRWNSRQNPMMMMVDVGAGTVDAAFFAVGRHGNIYRFSFFADEVQPNGVMNLHRKRIEWLRTVCGRCRVTDPDLMAFLDITSRPTDVLRPIPCSVLEYLNGYRIDLPPDVRSVDSKFFNQEFRPQVFRCIRGARARGIRDKQLLDVPFFLCGGGSRMEIYSGVTKVINDAPINVTVVEERIPKPEDVEAEGLASRDYDRLSVAYGLSRQGAGGKPLGEYVRRIDIPPVVRGEPRDYTELYIEQP